LLTTFIGTRAPVFVHAKCVPLPTSGDTYLAGSTFSDRSNSSTPTLSAALIPLPTSPGDWVLTYSGPASDGSKIHHLHRRPRCLEPVYINYFDFRIYLFYPPSSPSVGGWQHITMRFNNESKLLESVWFPSLCWIYNLDLNYSSMISPDNNPLKVIKRSSNITKLHVYVGPDLIPVPSIPDRTTNAQIIDDTNWGLSLDSGKSYKLLRADMIKDDENQSRPVPPAWMKFKGV
jgi:hypothetical protein